MVEPEGALIRQIKDLVLFHDLSERDLQQVLRKARLSTVQGGGFFFFQDDPAERVYVLLEGRVKLTKANPGEQPILLRVIVPPAVFAAVTMAQVDAYPVTAQAVEDSRALYWTKTEIMDLISQFPVLAVNAIRLVSNSVREFQERFHQLATERVERRLAHTLLRLARQAGKKTAEGVLIDLPLTRQDLAEMTGTTLYTVSRTLSQWEAQGLVTSGRERVVLRRPHGLVSIAEDLPDGGESHDG